MERLFHFLNTQGERHLPIVAEARGKSEDNMLEQVFTQLVTQGTAKVTAEQLRQLECLLIFERHFYLISPQLTCHHPMSTNIG